MEPRGNMSTYKSIGVMLNFKVDDVDAEHERLTNAGLSAAMALENHPWGNRGFAVMNPIGSAVYIYSDRETDVEFAQYHVR